MQPRLPHADHLPAQCSDTMSNLPAAAPLIGTQVHLQRLYTAAFIVKRSAQVPRHRCSTTLRAACRVGCVHYGSAPSDGVQRDLQDAACIQWPAAHAPRRRSGAWHRPFIRFAGRRCLWLPTSFACGVFVLCMLCGWRWHGRTGRPTVWTGRELSCLRGHVMMTVFGCVHGGCETV